MARNTILLSILFLIASTFACTTLQAQRGQPKYLVDYTDAKYSGFGGFSYDYSYVNGDFAVSSGGGGALLINYKWFFGGYGMSIQTRHKFPDIYPKGHSPEDNPLDATHTDNYLRFSYSGLWFGYIHNPYDMWHLSGSMKIGGGSVSLYDRDISFKEFSQHHRERVAVLCPEINLQVNVTRWFRIGMGLGYRFVYDLGDKMYTNSLGEELKLYSANDFSSPTANIRFLFGSFSPRTN